MKKKAQKFSYVMMIIFFLTGIAMTIVAAVTVGTIKLPTEFIEDFMDIPVYTANYHPFAKFVFPVILCGLVLTFGITSIWACVLEHFANVEKGVDSIYRNSTGKEELPDSAYTAVPGFVQNMNAPKAPAAYPQQYPQQYPQSVAPTAPAAPAASGAWFCPQCGTTNDNGSQFCSSCGFRRQ